MKRIVFLLAAAVATSAIAQRVEQEQPAWKWGQQAELGRWALDKSQRADGTVSNDPGITGEIQNEDEMVAKVTALNQALALKQISELDHAKQNLALLKHHAPGQYEVHTLASYRVLLATQLQDRKISRAEFDYMWEERRNQFAAKLTEQMRAAEEYQSARQRVAEREAQARAAGERQYRAEQERAAYAHQQAQEQASDTAAMGMFLKSIGNAFTRSSQQYGTNCVSNNYGGTVFTNCK